MYSRKTAVCLALFLVVALMATQCAPAATPTPVPATAVPKPIKFVVAGPMTGDVAKWGGYQLQGVQVAVDEINAAGGINGRKVEIQVLDDKCDATEAATVASRVASDSSVFAVIGHMCSSATLAAMPIYEQAGLTCLTASATNPLLCTHGWKRLFRTISHDNRWGPVLSDIAINTLGKKNVAIFYETNDWGRGLLDATTPAVKEKGGNLVDVETYTAGDKDFSAQLSKMKKAGADVLILLTNYTDAGLFARQRVAAGLGEVPLVGSTSTPYKEFLDLAGPAAEGTICGVNWDVGSQDPAAKALNDKWTAKFGEPCNEVNSYYYDAVYILKMAIEKGATKESLPDVLRTIEFKGPTGTTKFDATGDVVPKAVFAQIVKNGKWDTYSLKK